MVGHDLNRAVVVEPDQIKILAVGHFQPAQSMPFRPVLDAGDALGFARAGGKDFYGHASGEEALDHRNHLGNRLAQRIRRKEMSFAVVARKGSVEIHTHPPFPGHKDRLSARFKYDPGTRLAGSVGPFSYFQWPHGNEFRNPIWSSPPLLDFASRALVCDLLVERGQPEARFVSSW